MLSTLPNSVDLSLSLKFGIGTEFKGLKVSLASPGGGADPKHSPLTVL